MSMPKKSERLTRNEFSKAFTKGKRIHTPLFTLIVAQSEHFHAAAVVGKKVYKRSVDRNKLRRRLYAVLYQYRTKIHGTMIVLAKPQAATCGVAEIRTLLHSSLGRIASTKVQ